MRTEHYLFHVLWTSLLCTVDDPLAPGSLLLDRSNAVMLVKFLLCVNWNLLLVNYM